jgi:hypothetical protein
MKSAICLLPALLIYSVMAQADGPVQDLAGARGLAFQKVKPGMLRGIISDRDGRKLPGRQILVYDSSGNLQASAVSDEYGTYTIENLTEGTYLFQVDKTPVARLTVSRNATASTFMVVLPEGGLPSPVNWTLITLGGAAVAIAVPVIIHNSDDSSDHPTVSP